MPKGSYAWNRGFDDGEDKAIYCCFGWKQPIRHFETEEEQDDYVDGFDAGYESVD